MNTDTFSIDIDNIDVEDIMRQIRQKINEKQIKEVDMEMPTLSADGDVSEHLRLVNMTYHIEPHLPITSHRRILGKLIIFYKKVVRKLLKWYINPIAEQQENFNANVVRTLNSIDAREQKIMNYEDKTGHIVDRYSSDLKRINSQLVQLEKINEQSQQIDELYSRLGKLDKAYESLDQIEKLNQKIQQLIEKEPNINNMEQKLNGLEEELNKLRNQYKETKEQVNNQINEIESIAKGNVNEQDKQIQALIDINGVVERQNSVLNSRCRRIERHLRQQNISITEEQTIVKPEEQIDFDYFLFEEKYRGREEDIKDKLKIYLPYFKDKKNVLDIGCGRGEFLELLQEAGVTAKGIDLDDEMVLVCQEKGLDIEHIDAIEYLERLEDNSLGGIILTQVIEHMTPNYLIRLVKLANKKLMRGAYFIAETINPQCLIVFTEAYFMDLSHTKMIHPLTAQFIWESEGFNKVDLKYLSPVDDNMKIPLMDNMSDQFNASIETLNNLIYGYRDYAVVGRK